MKTHLEKIKKYFDENKRIYISCVITGAVCAGVTLLIAPKTSLSNVRQFQVLTWKSKQTVEVFVEALGDPGNIIQDMTTGIIYASQGQAARELKVSPARISENLAGKLPDVKGRIFKKLGKAVVSE